MGGVSSILLYKKILLLYILSKKDSRLKIVQYVYVKVPPKTKINVFLESGPLVWKKISKNVGFFPLNLRYNSKIGTFSIFCPLCQKSVMGGIIILLTGRWHNTKNILFNHIFYINVFFYLYPFFWRISFY